MAAAIACRSRACRSTSARGACGAGAAFAAAALDVLPPDRPAGSRAADGGGIDAELGGELPRQRRDPESPGGARRGGCRAGAAGATTGARHRRRRCRRNDGRARWRRGLLADDGEHGARRHPRARLDQDLLEHAGGERPRRRSAPLSVSTSAIDVAPRDGVARLLPPGDQRAGAHVRRRGSASGTQPWRAPARARRRRWPATCGSAASSRCLA